MMTLTVRLSSQIKGENRNGLYKTAQKKIKVQPFSKNTIKVKRGRSKPLTNHDSESPGSPQAKQNHAVGAEKNKLSSKSRN